MKWVELILGFLKEVLPTLTSFVVGRKSKEMENVKDENDKLKKYQEVDDTYFDDVYTSSLWK